MKETTETTFHVGLHLEQAPEWDREGELVGTPLSLEVLSGRNVGEADQASRRLRLRLLVREDADNLAGRNITAAFQVGYESSSQFSREYSRLFGMPPLKDVTKLRQMAVVE